MSTELLAGSLLGDGTGSHAVEHHPGVGQRHRLWFGLPQNSLVQRMTQVFFGTFSFQLEETKKVKRQEGEVITACVQSDVILKRASMRFWVHLE